MGRYVEDKPQGEDSDKEEPILQSKSTSVCGDSSPAHDDLRCMIPEAFEEHEKRRLERLIDDRCQKVILAHFEEAHERTEGNI